MKGRIKFFPIVNFITGSPGILRNGGIWRWIKVEIIKKRIPNIMMQALHFVDFNVTSNIFNKWFEGRTLKDWIREVDKNYTPKFFVDSGGFKHLHNKEYDLSDYNIKPTQEDIFMLQLRYGADFVASLDYPIPPNLNYKEARKRMELSIKNCLKLMELVYDKYSNCNVFPYLVVHGRNGYEAKYYTQNLFKNLEEYGYLDKPFGIAIGSLVPIKNHYELLFEIICSIKNVIEQYKKVNVHVFGISGYIIPFLIYLGIDSFDSNTYVQAAQNLRYIMEENYQKNFYAIDEKDLERCGCEYCLYLLNGGIENAKKILKSRGYLRHEFNGERINKSKIYSCIAMHNLEVQIRLINKLNGMKSKEEFLNWLINYSKGRYSGLKLISKLSDN